MKKDRSILWTYFIRAEATGPIKIGVSFDPLGRMRDLQNASPARLRLLGIMEGNVERRLHDLFRAHRIHGEWFRPHADLLTLIDKISSGCNVERLLSKKAKPAVTMLPPPPPPPRLRSKSQIPTEILSRKEICRRLGRNLSRILEERGMSALRFAKENGLCYRNVYRAAAGKTDPRGFFVFNMATALGVPVIEFFTPIDAVSVAG